ncbi:flavodoxin family protein [Krasilnikovia sp. MM14-A1259]
MHAVVVYESMYGNTHLVADAIGAGLGGAYQVDVVPVDKAEARLLERADLIVVGGPTHAHGMSRVSTREAAVADARKPDTELTLDPDAEGPSLRDWFDALPTLRARAAAFDTRVDLPALLTGRAAKGIGRRLRGHGLHMVAEPESFLVTKQGRLQPDEEARARQWGTRLADVAPDGNRAPVD